MTLTKPDFKLDKPNPYKETVTDAAWWLWLRIKELHKPSQLGGFYANKPGFHNKGNAVKDYSTQDKVNQSGPGMTHASALDWTFPDAQSGNYTNIDKFSSRLMASMLDKNDPRLDLILFEFYGQTDNDRYVEGYIELWEQYSTSDDSHLWHIHMSFLRSKVGDFWGMWALLTVLMGWSVAKWRDSLPSAPKPIPPKPKPTTPAPNVPHFVNGSRDVREGAIGSDVVFVQKFIGSKRMGAADGIAGPMFVSGLKWYQDMRSIHEPDPNTGKAYLKKGGPTWKAMGY